MAVILTTGAFTPYFNYQGALAVDGVVGPMTTSDTAQTFYYALTGMDPACADGPSTAGNSCGIHIHAGLSCTEDALGHYYANTLSADPWANVVYSSGLGSLTVETGLTAAEVDGHAMIIHDKTGGRIACAILAPVSEPMCPHICTENEVETCFYDPACSDPNSPNHEGGLGCNAGGWGQDCRFCGFTAEGNDTPFKPCPMCPSVCTGNPLETCYYDPTCADPTSPDYAGGLGCNAGGRGQECRFCGFADAEGNPFLPCPVCDLDAMAGGHTCGDRIAWLQTAQGLLEETAQNVVAAEYPAECGACAATQFPAPAPTCDGDADAGGYSCDARIKWLMQAEGLTAAAAGAKVEQEFPTQCQGCTYYYLTHYALVAGAAAVALLGAAGLTARKRLRRGREAQPSQPSNVPSAAAAPELRRTDTKDTVSEPKTASNVVVTAEV